MFRFAYEVAEKVLNAFVSSHPSKQFQHAYYRLKLFVRSIALGDYVAQGFDKQEALSFAWEDAEMAFRGRSEPSLGGVILQMWVHVGDFEKAFEETIKSAFRQANEATPVQTLRRYLLEDRQSPVLTSCKAVFSPALPSHGPLLRAWAKDNDEDIETLEAEALLDAEDERTFLTNLSGRTTTPTKGRRSQKSMSRPPMEAVVPVTRNHLRLVHNAAVD